MQALPRPEDLFPLKGHHSLEDLRRFQRDPVWLDLLQCLRQRYFSLCQDKVLQGKGVVLYTMNEVFNEIDRFLATIEIETEEEQQGDETN